MQLAIKRLSHLQLAQLLVFGIFLLVQWRTVSTASIEQYPLPQPIPASNLRVLTLGEAAIGAKLLGYWLLSYDTHAGRVIPFESLDYQRLSGWLTTISQLDPLSEYSSMVAGGVFIDVKDRKRQLDMVELVRERFNENPAVNWRWMAQVVMLAKYRLHDMPLALSLAKDLREHSKGFDIPYWAREMQAYLLQDMGELEASIVLLKAMIETGAITDPDELRFIEKRITELRASINAKRGDMSGSQQN